MSDQTPTERIAAVLLRNGSVIWDFDRLASEINDALCPKGESIRLDRTRDTDRLVRQRHEQTPAGRDVWADIEDGPDE